ncbi:Phosphoribosylaminoimidazole-succinocarboxamide synthase [subsurface metagenome]
MVKTYSEISIPELTLFKKGKVREVYEIEDKLLIVASDRISAFDYVLPGVFLWQYRE